MPSLGATQSLGLEVRYLLDTHLLLWAAGDSPRLPLFVRRYLEDSQSRPVFSAASIWEVAIKSSLGRTDFACDAGQLRRGLLEHGYEEWDIKGQHAAASAYLPMLRRDPFDRILIAQAQQEGVQLLTVDSALSAYGLSVRVLAPEPTP